MAELRPEDDVRVVAAEGDPFGWELTRGPAAFGTLRLEPGSHAELRLGDDGWELVPFGRGWRLAVTDGGGEPHAWYDARGWRRRGRLLLAPDRELALTLAVAWRDARLTDEDGALLARLDTYRRDGRREVTVDVLAGPPPATTFACALAASLVLMRAELRAPPGPHGTWVGAGDWFGGDGGGGGGGDGGGAGGG